MTARPRRAGATVAAALGVALAVGAVLVAPRLDAWGVLDHDLVATKVSENVVPASTTLGCPGPVEIPDGDRTAAAQSSTVTSALGLVELAPGAVDDVLPVSADATSPAPAPLATLTGTDPLAVLGAAAVTGPGPWSVRGTAAHAVAGADRPAAPAQPVGAVAHGATSGDLRGLATAACVEPGTDQWIVAGETETGEQASVVLDNPGRTTVTVTLELWGAAGAVTPAAASTYVLPALGHESVLLATLAPAERRLVVHVTSTGGAVGATVAESRLDGVVPRGVTLAGPGAAASTVQVVPGVSLEASDVDATDAGVLRLLAPQHATTATVTLLGTGGREVVRGAETVDLAAGEVTDVSLAGVRAGTYTVVVSAAQPLLAGARIVHQGSAVTESSGSVQVTVGTSADVAWLPSSTLVRDTTGATATGQPTSAVAVPSGLVGYVVLTPLPNDAADHLAALDDVPVDYGDGAADPRPAVARGTVEAYDASGALVGSQVVSAPLGVTVTVPLATLAPGADVAAVKVTGAGAGSPEPTAPRGVDLVWTLLAARGDVPGSVDGVAPRYPEAADRAVTVRPSTTIGR